MTADSSRGISDFNGEGIQRDHSGWNLKGANRKFCAKKSSTDGFSLPVEP